LACGRCATGQKIYKRGTEPDSLRGLFAATVDRKPAVVEYEPDTDLRDTEQAPLLEEGGIGAFRPAART
jgi:type I restriction enzyme M protein